MAQDIRELLRQDKQIPSERMREGHELRFMSRLEAEIPEKKSSFSYGWLNVAASIVVIISVSLLTYNQFGSKNARNNQVVDIDNTLVKNSSVVLTKEASSLAKISPEYEELENSMLTAIRVQLLNITIDDKNRELVESFKTRLNDLDKEYQKLNRELMEVGPNVQSVEAMMENLTIRLSLLTRLKDKLKELERIENENYNEIQA